MAVPTVVLQQYSMACAVSVARVLVFFLLLFSDHEITSFRTTDDVWSIAERLHCFDWCFCVLCHCVLCNCFSRSAVIETQQSATDCLKDHATHSTQLTAHNNTTHSSSRQSANLIFKMRRNYSSSYRVPQTINTEHRAQGATHDEPALWTRRLYLLSTLYCATVVQLWCSSRNAAAQT